MKSILLTDFDVAELALIWGAMHDLAECSRLKKNDDDLIEKLKMLDQRFEKVLLKKTNGNTGK